jgi:hypothetical protein
MPGLGKIVKVTIIADRYGIGILSQEGREDMFTLSFPEDLGEGIVDHEKLIKDIYVRLVKISENRHINLLDLKELNFLDNTGNNIEL